MTKCELDEDKTNRHANVEGGNLRSSQPQTRTSSNQIKLRAGEIVFPREKDIDWYFNNKWSTLEACIQ